MGTGRRGRGVEGDRGPSGSRTGYCLHLDAAQLELGKGKREKNWSICPSVLKPGCSSSIAVSNSPVPAVKHPNHRLLDRTASNVGRTSPLHCPSSCVRRLPFEMHLPPRHLSPIFVGRIHCRSHRCVVGGQFVLLEKGARGERSQIGIELAEEEGMSGRAWKLKQIQKADVVTLVSFSDVIVSTAWFSRWMTVAAQSQ